MNSLTTRQAAILLGVVLLVVAGCFAWQHFHQPQPITGESQRQAETPAGVELAAKNAHIDMLKSQLNEAAAQIAALNNKPPERIIQTIPYEVTKTVEVERQKSGADFAIVTDPKQPDKQVDLKEIEKLPTNTPVTLNQYNVQAYKPILRGYNIYPGLDSGRVKINEVSTDVSRKISKDGKYLGVVAGYDFEHDKAKVGIRYSF